MISLPFEEAQVSAILFFVSEFVLIPVFTACTSMWAYYLLICNCRLGKKVNISPLPLPFFSDGLLRNFRLHYLLLLLRFAIVSVPVYLGLRLNSRTKPVMKQVKVGSSFCPLPRIDYYAYEDKVDFNATLFREVSTSAYDACMEFDEEGWAIACSAQVDINRTNNTNDSTISFSTPKCLPGTQRRLFRDTGSVPGLNVEHEDHAESLEGEYQLNITWIRGNKSSFPQSTNFGRCKLATTVLKTEKVSINLTDVECFSSSGLHFQGELNIGEYVSNIVCHNVTGNKVEFLSMRKVSISSTESVSVNDAKVTTLHGSTSKKLYRIAELEFADGILFNASHFVNNNPEQVPVVDYESFETALRLLLYTQNINKTFSVESKEMKTTTTLDSTFLITAGVYVGVVLFSGLFTLLHAKLTHNVHIRPNTLSGLSTLWAAHLQLKRGSGIDSKQRIELTRDLSARKNDGDGFFEPSVDLRE